MDASVLVGVAACLLSIFILWWLFETGKRPPGPVGLPFLGYAPFLSKLPHLELQKLAKKYGNVFSLRLGTQYTVIINDYQSSKEAYASDDFMGRPPVLPFDFNKETVETGAVIGLPWKEQRRFSMHMLHNLGFGKTKMESIMQEEVQDLIEHLQKNVDKPYFLRGILAPSMSNNIGALMFGKRFKYDDPVRQMLTHTVKETAKAAGQVQWPIFFPWLKPILDALGINYNKNISQLQMELKVYIKKEIEEHKKTLNPSDIRDYIDGYLLEIEKRKGDPTFSGPILEDMVLGFFIAGSETVRQGVEWLIVLAAAHPDQQRRIQAEIDEVIGRNRLPTQLDMKNMPFTQAFSMEVMRFRPVLPINILRYTLNDTQLNGYTIPKHSYVIGNLWAIHHDKEYWGDDVEEFHPERFLTKDSKEMKKSEHYIPFSIGKRSCPGEHLAKHEMFLYFTSILQHFTVKLPEGKTEDFGGNLGLSLSPNTEEIVFTKRT